MILQINHNSKQKISRIWFIRESKNEKNTEWHHCKSCNLKKLLVLWGYDSNPWPVSTVPETTVWADESNPQKEIIEEEEEEANPASRNPNPNTAMAVRARMDLESLSGKMGLLWILFVSCESSLFLAKAFSNFLPFLFAGRWEGVKLIRIELLPVIMMMITPHLLPLTFHSHVRCLVK